MRTIDIFCKYDDIKQIENMYSNAIISSYRLYTPIEAENNVFEKKYISNLMYSYKDEIPKIIIGKVPKNKNEVLVPNIITEEKNGSVISFENEINDKLSLKIDGIEYEFTVCGIYDIFSMLEYKENIFYINQDLSEVLNENKDVNEVYRIISRTSSDCNNLFNKLVCDFMCQRYDNVDSIEEKENILLVINTMYIILSLFILISVIIFICFIIKSKCYSQDTNMMCYIMGANFTIICHAEFYVIFKMIRKSFFISSIFLLVILVCVFYFNLQFFFRTKAFF